MNSIFFNTIRKISESQLNEIAISTNRCINENYKIKNICRICQNKCVVNAIDINKGIKIDWNKCIKCGVCAAVCPTEVFIIQAPSDKKILNSIILSKYEKIVIECNFVNKSFQGKEKKLRKKGNKIIVPCIGRFSETFLLLSILSGGEQVEFVGCTSDCEFLTGRRVINEMWNRTEHLLKLFEITSNEKKDDIKQRNFFTEKRIMSLRNLLPQNKSTKVNNKIPPHRGEILELIKGYSGDSIQINRKKMPFGEIKVASEKCKLQGICSSVCPTDALKFLESNQGKELKFSYGLCVGCRACTYVCPEEALGIEKTIDLSQLVLLHKTIMDKKYLFCKSCGKHFSLKTNNINSSKCNNCIKQESSIEEYYKESKFKKKK